MQTAVVAQAPAATLTPAQIDERVNAAVAKAVAEVDTRYAEKTKVQLAEFKQTADALRAQVILASTELDKVQMRRNNARLSAMVRPDENGDAK